MCELLGMSANIPADICFSFAGLMRRGGHTGPHKDGWGVAFYEGKGCRLFHDPHPSSQSEIAKLIRHYPIKSKLVICHIRKANRGRVCLENTHPFLRQVWGRNWTFSHNGQLRGVKKLPLKHFRPIGTTDSEYAFCWLLDQVVEKFDEPPKKSTTLWSHIRKVADQLSEFGVFNFMLCDSKYLYAHCSTKLAWITRRAPFSSRKAKLVDDDIELDFQKAMSPNDIITIIATTPLTNNENWTIGKKGDFLVFSEGELLFSENKVAE